MVTTATRRPAPPPPRARRRGAVLTGLAVVAALLAACSTGSDAETGADGQAGPTTSAVAGTDPGPTVAGTEPTDPGTTTAASTGTDGPDASDAVTSDDGVDGDAGPDEPPFPADTSPDTAEPSGFLVHTDFRIGRQDGFDRVVWEFAGDGEPGWRVQYVDDPTRQGSGEPVDLPGGATLELLLTTVAIPGSPETGGVAGYDGPRVRAAASTELVTEVVVGATFEGVHDAFVGVESEVPFRVYRLADPPRVVLEVRRP